MNILFYISFIFNNLIRDSIDNGPGTQVEGFDILNGNTKPNG